MSLAFIVVCEAATDRVTASSLADVVILNDIAWMDEELLEHSRRCVGLTLNESQLLWRDVHKTAKLAGLKAHGHFDGRPGAADAYIGRLTLLLVKNADITVDAILLIRDDDLDQQRRQGLEQARLSVRLDVPVIIGLAHPKRECWVLAGFEPRDQAEQNRLLAVRQELGFDPRLRASELTAKHDHDKKSAKRVLGLLTDYNPVREHACFQECEMLVLFERGVMTGLRDYLYEVRESIVPLFTH